MRSRKRVFLGLGSNLGDRLGYLLSAMDRISELGEVRAISTVYESEPWGVEEQPPFLNCVLEFWTDIPPEELLKMLKEIERAVGRRERFHWGPREIDIDILLYGNEVFEGKELKIPHPHLEERDFVLVPLLEVDRKLRNPKNGRSLSESLNRLEVKLKPFCCIYLKREKGSRSPQ